MVLFTLYKSVKIFECVDKILWFGNSHETFPAEYFVWYYLNFCIDFCSIYLSESEVSEETPVVKPLRWEEDMQLFSRFLDRKVTLLTIYLFRLFLYAFDRCSVCKLHRFSRRSL